MTDDRHIHRRPDGSIDTGHYMALGRQARAEQARYMIQTGLGQEPRHRERRRPRPVLLL